MTRSTFDIAWNLLAYAIIALIIAGIIGIRLLIAGGDWGCMFAQDAALCAAVKEATP